MPKLWMNYQKNLFNMKKDFLTASDYYYFLQCPHWPYYNRFHTPEELLKKREQTEAEKNRLEDGLAHETEVVQELFKDAGMEIVPEGDVENSVALTLKLMQKGVPLIYQGTLQNDDWRGRPDLLRRVEGQSDFGDWMYEPVDIKSSHNLEKYQKLQLMFYAVLLEEVQGRFPSRGYIINKDKRETPVELGEDITDFKEVTDQLERIRAGEKPEPVLRKSCIDTGPWGALCQLHAESTNDIALLFNVDVKKLRALRELGIRTISDAAQMDVMDLDGRGPGLRVHSLEVAKLQAQSLLRSQVIVREPIELRVPATEIHFDIESDPPNDQDYLYGFLIRNQEGEHYKPFVARGPEEEEKMWCEFLDWITTLPADYHVIHYASYERIRLDVLEGRYGGSPALDLFRKNMVDFKQIVASSIVFPQYFYGLKYLAKFLGFSWRSDVKSGGASVDVYEDYLKTRDEKKLDSIILYNEDDVRATALLADFCRAYARELTAYDPPYPWRTGIPANYPGERTILR